MRKNTTMAAKQTAEKPEQQPKQATFRARLDPEGKAQRYAVCHGGRFHSFRREGGWYSIGDRSLAEKLAKIRESDFQPEKSPHCFQVVRDEASAPEASDA